MLLVSKDCQKPLGANKASEATGGHRASDGPLRVYSSGNISGQPPPLKVTIVEGC